MINTVESEYTPDVVSPPRDTLRELIEERGMTQVELAKRMGKTPKAISEILSDNDDVSITPETALQLEQALGAPAQFWLNRENAYRVSKLKQKESEGLEKAIDWLDSIPVTQLRRLGYVKAKRKGVDAVREVLSFFRVTSIESWQLFWSEAEISYHKSSVYDSKIGHLATWLQLGQIQAEKISFPPFSQSNFLHTLKQIRELTTATIEEIVDSTSELCRSAGVGVVFVPEMPKTHVCGAARWINGGSRPVIYLSLRHKTDDHFWFTFYHEACHILKHGKRSIYIDDKNPDGARLESEANQFSRNFLIPPNEYDRFKKQNRNFYRNVIESFAQSINISPGIVVGRLQHDGLLDQTFHNRLKRRFTFNDSEIVEIKKAN
jgi:addiction module HigA family antidote